MTAQARPDDSEIASLFSIDRYDVGHVTAIDRDAGVRIVTDPRQWSHAVEFRPYASTDFKDGPLRIVVRLEVESGRIEVGALSTTGTTFLSSLIVESGSHAVELHVPALARCQSITVRNAGQVVSTVRVASIAVNRDHRNAETTSGPDLSAPYGMSRRGFWDKNIFADIRRLAGADSRVLFHVGAHRGDETALFLEIFKHARVHCFEPSPTTFRELQDRFRDEPRAEVHQVAVSDRAGAARFHVNTRPETDSLFSLVADRPEGESATASVIDVQTSTIDNLLDRMQVPLLDVLCLDAQGAELAILRGAADTLGQRRVRVLMAEVIWVPLYEGQGTYYDVLHWLGHTGYALYDLYNFRYSESGQLLWGDALFLPGPGASDRSGSV